MINKICTLLMLIISAISLSACEDKSVASCDNLIEAINNVISKEEIYIVVPCLSLRADKTVPPFVVIDPMLKNKNNYRLATQKEIYLNRIVQYAKAMERSGAISLRQSRFKLYLPYTGEQIFSGYEVDYDRNIARTLQPTPFYGLGKANVGRVQVSEILKTTNPFFNDGVKYVDITFNIKLTDVLDCIDEELLYDSFVKEEVDDVKATYRLYLDKDSLSWKVKDPKALNIDPVRKFFSYLIE